MTIDPAKLYQSFTTRTANQSLARRFNEDVVYNDENNINYNNQDQLKESHFAQYLLQAAKEDGNNTLSAAELDKATGIGLHHAQMFVQHHSNNGVNFSDMEAVAQAINIVQADTLGDGKLEAYEKRDIIEQLYHDMYATKTSDDLIAEFKANPNQTDSEIRFGRNYTSVAYERTDYDASTSSDDAYDYFEAAAGQDGLLDKTELKDSTGLSDTAIEYLYATNSTLEKDIGTAATLFDGFDGEDGAHNGVVTNDVKANIEKKASAWKSSQSVQPSNDPSDDDGNVAKKEEEHSSSFSLSGLFGGIFGGGSDNLLKNLMTAGLIYFGAQTLFSLFDSE